jgi:hypothetical protein
MACVQSAGPLHDGGGLGFWIEDIGSISVNCEGVDAILLLPENSCETLPNKALRLSSGINSSSSHIHYQYSFGWEKI